MNHTKKWTIIGGGSVRAVFFAHSLARKAQALHVGTLCLTDIDPDRLHLIGTLAAHVVNRTAPQVNVVLETDPKAAITGSDYIVTTIRVGGDRTRVDDEALARKYGVLGQETTGVGGFFMAARSLPVLADYCKLIQELAPQAWVFNFTNPSGLVTQGLRDLGFDRVVGICDTPNSTKQRIAQAMGYDNEEFYMEFYGLNHLSWAHKAVYDQQEVLSQILENQTLTEAVGELGMFDPEFLRILGQIPNEYLYYYYYRDQALAHTSASSTPRGIMVEENSRNLIRELTELDPEKDPEACLRAYLSRMYRREAAYMSVETGGKQVLHVPDTLEMPAGDGYAGIAMDFAMAVETGTPRYVVLSVPNQGSIRGLRDSDVVEITCLVDRAGAHPVHIGEVDDSVFPLLLSVKNFERLAVEAILNRSRKKAVEALLAHPLIGSYPLARSIVDKFMESNPFIGTWND